MAHSDNRAAGDGGLDWERLSRLVSAAKSYAALVDEGVDGDSFYTVVLPKLRKEEHVVEMCRLLGECAHAIEVLSYALRRQGEEFQKLAAHAEALRRNAVLFRLPPR